MGMREKRDILERSMRGKYETQLDYRQEILNGHVYTERPINVTVTTDCAKLTDIVIHTEYTVMKAGRIGVTHISTKDTIHVYYTTSTLLFNENL